MVLDVGEGIEAVVGVCGWVVDCRGSVVAVGCGGRVGGVVSAVVLVVLGAAVGGGAGTGETGTYTGPGAGAGRTPRYRTSTAMKAAASATVERRARMGPITRGDWAA
ncbi:MAG: hypothetical protein M3378_06550 [Actinomycetota bacterium]|nr:hypothetical protein [Actinomycetota bacterium]